MSFIQTLPSAFPHRVWGLGFLTCLWLSECVGPRFGQLVCPAQSRAMLIHPSFLSPSLVAIRAPRINGNLFCARNHVCSWAHHFHPCGSSLQKMVWSLLYRWSIWGSGGSHSKWQWKIGSKLRSFHLPLSHLGVFRWPPVWGWQPNAIPMCVPLMHVILTVKVHSASFSWAWRVLSLSVSVLSFNSFYLDSQGTLIHFYALNSNQIHVFSLGLSSKLCTSISVCLWHL